ncbi:MAG: hypothetical protein DRP79_06300 [Planctomycetota bacterium]|nr:MAG: hypothetical protein DRP79_06300 [Planctomycetota bacterium]
MLAALLSAGCASGVRFPARPVSECETPLGTRLDYDTSGDGAADYFAYRDKTGRISVVAYDYSKDGKPDSMVRLDSLPVERCRHVLIILDGVAYDLAREYYEEGHLRMFHPPSRVVAPFPGLTDVCIEDALGCIPNLAFEALYYDRRKERLTRGAWDYLYMRNEPFAQLLTYRAHTICDTISYFSPWQIFKHEIKRVKETFDRRDRQDVLVYLVGSAGMGTGNGRKGHVRCLELVERLVNQMTWETRGMVKFTLMADHGHTYTEPERLDIVGRLKEKGWHSVRRLRRPGDFIPVEFGVVTYAAFYTRDAAGLAADIAAIDGVDLAAYHRDGAVFVRSSDGCAVVRERNGRYAYEAQEGDPLQLNGIIAKLSEQGKVDADGFIEDAALFEATLVHVYPDPLRRLWRAFHAEAENVPDVIASLRDDRAFGSGAYDMLVKVKSTHGSLNRRNSTTFIMSTAGPLPPAMRSDEIPGHMSALLGRPFPPGKR